MKVIELSTWNRRQHFEHFKQLKDPYFGVTVPFDVTQAYKDSKKSGQSFFGRYLHDCLLAINDIEAMRMRVQDEKIVVFDEIHASATIARADHTFGFSFIKFDSELNLFNKNILKEKDRIQNTQDLYPTENGLDCIHCSALPWFSFTGHKEPVSGLWDSIPKFAFGKMEDYQGRFMMNVAINVNHALVDGYHIGLFVDRFQYYLNQEQHV